jgi:hypothetical protein
MALFHSYFKANMEALDLAAPETLFGTLQTAVATATALVAHVDKFGTRVTIGELVGAGTKLEALGAVAACTVAFYAGAVIGSIAVATGRSIAGGVTIADIVFTANQHNLNRNWLLTSLMSGR